MCLHEATVVAIASQTEGHARDDIMDQSHIPPLLVIVHSGRNSAADLLYSWHFRAELASPQKAPSAFLDSLVYQ